MRSPTDERILDHYRREASEHDLRPTSTMKDETTREFEISSIMACLGHAATRASLGRLLEIGCGNGYLLSLIRDRFPGVDLVGLESPQVSILDQIP